MNSFLDIALQCAARGWFVFPCRPRGKTPITLNGFKDASREDAQIRGWWAKTPDANVAIACGASGLAVFDIDHGLANRAGYERVKAAMNLPSTYAVRTGRRDDFGVQVYLSGAVGDVGDFRIHGCNGQIKSLGGYVMAVGSVHPVSGELYEALEGNPDRLAALPDNIRALKSEKPKTGKPGEPITENRNIKLYGELCALRARGHSEDGLVVAGLQFNADNIVPPLEEEEVKQIARNAAKHDVPAPAPTILFGEEKKIKDWRELFHSKEDALNAPPISFLIQGFLQCEGTTAIAAPVRERKSLIALNIVHALLTGDKLFDHFEVCKQPSRVLYLCPEVSLGPFTDRVKKIGLIDYVGKTFFYRTLSADGHLKLGDPTLKEALPGSVIFLDTAVRFLEGKENDSGDVRKFADGIFALLKGGAASVVMLHHSPKESGDAMTLENAMRGSGDMGAFLACCWGTKLQDPTKPYESASFLSNLKQRDFESSDFEITCGPNCRMHIVSATQPATLQSRRGNKGNKDGQDSVADAFIRANVRLPVRKIEEALAGMKVKRGTTWIAKARARIQMEAGEVTVGS
jgi:hypothetical protein